MLTPTAMNKLRTIGFNQADFQAIKDILSESMDHAETTGANEAAEQSPGRRPNKSRVKGCSHNKAAHLKT